MKSKLYNALSVLALLALSTFNTQLSTAFAQGTAFTYQGQLANNGSPANGGYDLVFVLYDANFAGSQVGPILTNAPTAVSNGLFAVTLNFGAGVFTGSSLWLDISVRTNGRGAFSELSPRQLLTPTPYAIFANTASNVSGTISAAQVSGTILNASLPGSPVFSGAVAASSFAGDGSNVTNVNAAGLNGLNATSFWQLGGNSGTMPGANFVGTSDNHPLELHVNGMRGLRMEFGGKSSLAKTNTLTGAPNMIGGSPVNVVASGVVGAVIAGGGATNYAGAGYTNSIGAFSDFSTIGGGQQNAIQTNSFASTIAGGQQNIIQTNANHAAIGGGWYNIIGAYGYESTIAGGYYNTNTGSYSVVGGGVENLASGYISTVAGGYDNIASGENATVGGGGGFDFYSGYGNVASGDWSTVSGGYDNQASGYESVVGGGASNAATNSNATVPGGQYNLAGGTSSFAAGQKANALHQGAFVWGDSQDAVFASTGNDQFLIRAQGGVGINTAGPQQSLSVVGGLNIDQGSSNNGYLNENGLSGAGLTFGDSSGEGIASQRTAGANQYDLVLYTAYAPRITILGSAGNGNVGIGTTTPTHPLQMGSGAYCSAAGMWTSVSDRNAKEGFTSIKPAEVLAKVAALPVSQWKYKAERNGIKHLGPMAQDFYSSFGLGDNDKAIGTVDEGGVALAAIQGLNQKLQEELTRQEAENATLKQQNDSLVARLNKLEAKVRQLAAQK